MKTSPFICTVTGRFVFFPFSARILVKVQAVLDCKFEQLARTLFHAIQPDNVNFQLTEHAGPDETTFTSGFYC